MKASVLGVVGFLVILTIYITGLALIAPFLPAAFLIALLGWFTLRRPFSPSGSAESDIDMFGQKTGEVAVLLIKVLVQPLSRW